MPTQQIAVDKRGKRKSQSRFQRLWTEAESLASDNASLENELDALVKRVERDVMSAELEMGKTIRELVSHQIRFARKKSLLKWQRAELNDWIEDNLADLISMGLLDEPLQDEMAQLRAFELGIDLDPDSDLSPTQQLDNYFGVDDSEWDFDADSEQKQDEANGTTGDLFDDEFDETLDETEDEEFEDSLEDDEALAELLRKLNEEFEGFQPPSDNPSPPKQKNPISEKVFKRLFQQTAAALHPDKETDELRQAEKHKLMSQLLKARKDRDLVTLLQLHEQHAAAESSLSADDEQALEDVLIDYLSQQQDRMDDIIMRSPMHHMAYTQFYSKKPATVTRKINAHLKKIDDRRLSLRHFMADVKTLKRLKEVLSARYDAHVFRGGW